MSVLILTVSDTEMGNKIWYGISWRSLVTVRQVSRLSLTNRLVIWLPEVEYAWVYVYADLESTLHIALVHTLFKTLLFSSNQVTCVASRWSRDKLCKPDVDVVNDKCSFHFVNLTVCVGNVARCTGIDFLRVSGRFEMPFHQWRARSSFTHRRNTPRACNGRPSTQSSRENGRLSTNLRALSGRSVATEL